MFNPRSPPGILHKDSTHRFSRGAKKVAAAVPVLRLLNIDETDIRLVDQGRGLKRLPRFFVAKLLHSQFAQFIVQQRQELFCGGGIRYRQAELSYVHTWRTQEYEQQRERVADFGSVAVRVRF